MKKFVSGTSCLLSLLALIGFSFSSCQKEDPPEDENDQETYDRGPMLSNIGDNIIIPAYEELANKIDTLDLYLSNFQSSPNQITLDSLRAAWKRSLIAWQYAGIYQVGPAETVLLRDNINLYPVDTAEIKSNYINGGYDLNAVSNFDAKGLQALDYMLYGLGPDDISILTQYTTDQYASNRFSYLNAIVSDMNILVDGVLNDWLPSGGNYIQSFKNSTGIDVGSSTAMLVNAFNYHYERYVRSGKIGIPSGVLLFTQTPQPEKVEAWYNKMISIELALHAIQAIENLYHGIGVTGNGVGFYEYLEYLGTQGNSGLLADDISDQIDVAQTEVNTIPEPLYDQVQTNQQHVFDVYSELQTLVVLFKNDMTSAMGVIITYADTDGD